MMHYILDFLLYELPPQIDKVILRMLSVVFFSIVRTHRNNSVFVITQASVRYIVDTYIYFLKPPKKSLFANLQ